MRGGKFLYIMVIPCLAGAQPPASVAGPDPVRIARDPSGNRQADIRNLPSDINYFQTYIPTAAPLRSWSAFSQAGQNQGKDSWTGMDKARHFTASFIITGAAAYWMKHEMNADAVSYTHLTLPTILRV